MVITQVTIKLVPHSEDKLMAFATVSFDDCFMIRDIKVIQGSEGYFIAMPSRKVTYRCYHCGDKNHLQAKFCNQCGKAIKRLTRIQTRRRSRLHADLAHPLNASCRKMIHDAVVKAFDDELARSKLPGYVPQILEEEEQEAKSEDSARPTPTPLPSPLGSPLNSGSARSAIEDSQKIQNIAAPNKEESGGEDDSGGFGILR